VPKYLTSSRTVTSRDWTNPGFFDGSTYGSLPIWNGDYAPYFRASMAGQCRRSMRRAAGLLGSAADSIKYLDTCGSIYENSLNCNTQKGTEDVSAAYTMVQFHTGDWEITPGVRFEHTYIHNVFWVTDTTVSPVGHFGGNHTIYNELLPSIFVNYRPEPNAVYRAESGRATPVPRSSSWVTTARYHPPQVGRRPLPGATRI